ncbi:MAG: hypothetical protein DHS20C15_33910 [Planctomycetota bacterium]|nr:MAG: hypothetical protein DHS20C15_33910 [Planctomycetota bacterium]
MNITHSKRLLIVSAALIGSVITLGESVSGQAPQQLAKLESVRPQAHEGFGVSVALRGDLVVIGAPGGDGLSAGSVELFDASAPGQPVFLAALGGPLSAQHRSLGAQVALSRRLAVVSAPFGATGDPEAGAVLIYDIRDPAHPLELARIPSPEDTFLFGELLDLDGDRLLISSSFSLDAPQGPWLYSLRDPSAPVLLSELHLDGSVDHEGQLRSVLLRGDLAIVGAPFDSQVTPLAGAAYVFDISDPEQPQQLAQVQAPVPELQGFFGSAVASNGRFVAIAATGDSELGKDAGAVYIYDLAAPAGAAPLTKILARNGQPGERFGQPLTWAGDTLLVSRYFSGSGSVDLFDMSQPAAPRQLARFSARDSSPRDRFGVALAVHADKLLVGAHHDSDKLSRAGSASLFNWSR